MDPAEVKSAASDAISEMPDKNYIDVLVTKLEDNLNGTINAAIEAAVRPLNNKIELLERKFMFMTSISLAWRKECVKLSS